MPAVAFFRGVGIGIGRISIGADRWLALANDWESALARVRGSGMQRLQRRMEFIPWHCYCGARIRVR